MKLETSILLLAISEVLCCSVFGSALPETSEEIKKFDDGREFSMNLMKVFSL